MVATMYKMATAVQKMPRKTPKFTACRSEAPVMPKTAAELASRMTAHRI